MRAPIRGLIMLLAERYPNAVNRSAFLFNTCNNILDKIIDGPASNGCIVGQAVRMSNCQELISKMECNSFSSARNLLDGYVDPKDIYFAQRVQKLQDSKAPWGKCVEIAISEGL